MHLRRRIELMLELKRHIQSENAHWLAAKSEAFAKNPWFIPEFINNALDAICQNFLNESLLSTWANTYEFPDDLDSRLRIGLVMAGNIPLAGFHDFLAIFLSGHRQVIKASTKDLSLIGHVVQYLAQREPATTHLIQFEDILSGCDAYIATGSNNSARYFDYYFSRFPHVIRRNRTSVAIIRGDETSPQLEALANDIFLYFGLGCRNVTQIFVPTGYNFEALLSALSKYSLLLLRHHKYKNNYDYQLTLLLLNKTPYLTNGSILLLERDEPFSPISVLHYTAYTVEEELHGRLLLDDRIQCIIGNQYVPLGQSQRPRLTDYADGIDTMRFLKELYNTAALPA